MRTTLETYLGLEGHTVTKLAHKLGVSRQTVRRLKKDDSLAKIVDFDVKTGLVAQVEIGKMRIVKGIGNA